MRDMVLTGGALTIEIDGIRFDNTTNYYVAGSILGLPGLLGSIEFYVNATGRQNFSMTLEHLRLDAAAVVNASAATPCRASPCRGFTRG